MAVLRHHLAPSCLLRVRQRSVSPQTRQTQVQDPMPPPVIYSQMTHILPVVMAGGGKQKLTLKETGMREKHLVLKVISRELRVSTFIYGFIMYIKKEIMLNVLCGNYSILLLLPWFIIFTARWLKPKLNKYFKRIPTIALSRFPLSSLNEKDHRLFKNSDVLVRF